MFGGFHFSGGFHCATDPDERATTSFASGALTHRVYVMGGRKVILGEVAKRL